MKDSIDKGVRTVEAGGNIMQGIGRVAMLLTVVAVLVAGYFIYDKVMNIGGAVVDAGVAVYDAGTEGVTATIENTGEAAKQVRESLGTALETATEGVDVEAVGEGLDDAVDGGIGWLKEKKEALTDAIATEEE